MWGRWRHAPWLAARRHVVCARALAPDLQQADGAQNLQLAQRGHGIPLRTCTADVREVGVGERVGPALQRPREVDFVLADDEADKGRHRHATVLDLSGAEPGDRRARGLGQRGNHNVLETRLSDAEPG